MAPGSFGLLLASIDVAAAGRPTVGSVPPRTMPVRRPFKFAPRPESTKRSSSPQAPAAALSQCNRLGCDELCYGGHDKSGRCNASAPTCVSVLQRETGFLASGSMDDDKCAVCNLCDANHTSSGNENDSIRMRRLEASEAASLRSWSFCTGPCCGPNQRNRSCVWGNLLFKPPDRFFYVTDDGARAEANVSRDAGVYLHNRFADAGKVWGRSYSFFTPTAAGPEVAAGVDSVLEDPLFITSDLHGNIGHNMLDAVFPIFAAGVRLRASARALLSEDREVRAAAKQGMALVQRGARGGQPLSLKFAARLALQSVPQMEDGSAGSLARLLIVDQPRYVTEKAWQKQYMEWWKPMAERSFAHWHRGREERAWTGRIFGRMSDLAQLVEACPRGCFIRSAIGGVGHTGLCVVDEENRMAGARAHRSLWHFRQRVFVMHAVMSPPAADARKHVVFVNSRRQSVKTVGRLAEVMEAVKQLLPWTPSVELVSWEKLSFLQRLRTFEKLHVLVSGVGTAQMSAYLVPAGAVILCMGWRFDEARSRIYYFDSHILHGIDHARVLYYPNYGPEEIGVSDATKGFPIVLNVSKASAHVASALRLHSSGFPVPVAEDENGNFYDRAYAELGRRTGGVSHRVRTGDDRLPPQHKASCATLNSVHEMLWGPAASACPWKAEVPGIIRDLGL